MSQVETMSHVLQYRRCGENIFINASNACMLPREDEKFHNRAKRMCLTILPEIYQWKFHFICLKHAPWFKASFLLIPTLPIPVTESEVLTVVIMTAF